MVLAHGMVDHEEHFSKNVEKSNGIYLTAGFLFKNGFVDEVFNDECEADEKVNKNISECYDDIDRVDDFDVESDNFEVEKGDISAVNNSYSISVGKNFD